MSGVNSLETLRRRAVHIKRERGLKHYQALNLAANEHGYQNYTEAVRLLKPALSDPNFHRVTLSQTWSNRQTGQRNVEKLVITLRQPLTDLIKPRQLVGNLGGTQIIDNLNLTLPYEVSVDDRAEYAIKRLQRVARTLEFIEITGLYPSTALRCYPKGNWNNRPPIADHDNCWYDPKTKRYLLTIEPYPGRPDRHQAQLHGWQEKHGYGLSQIPWGSIYGYGTEMWVAAKNGTFDLEQLSILLSSKPSKFSDDK